MAAIKRKPLEGVINILRFNWHFYLGAVAAIAVLILIAIDANGVRQEVAKILVVLFVLGLAVSLLASAWVYDLSGLYQFRFLPAEAPKVLVNIHAGFDESSAILQAKYPKSKLVVLDFYDSEKHTEISIRRARKAHAPFPQTFSVAADKLPVATTSADLITVLFAAHEIRQPEERIAFLRELYRILKPGGKLFLAEHLRDVPNALVYSVGVFHFYARNTWLRAFSDAGFGAICEEKHTPFVSIFILTKHAAA